MKLSVLLAAVGLTLAAPAFAQANCLNADAYQLGRQHSAIPAACASDNSYVAAYRQGESVGQPNLGIPAAFVAGAVLDNLINDDDDGWHDHHRDRDHHHHHDHIGEHHRGGDFGIHHVHAGRTGFGGHHGGFHGGHHGGHGGGHHHR